MNTTATAATKTAPGPFDSLLTRDRFWILAGIAGMTGLSWLYLLWTAAGMETMQMADVMLGAQPTRWTSVDFLLMFLMWAIMMVAMILPSATPMILLFAMVNRRRQHQRAAVVSPVVFAAGYLGVWTVFSLVATAMQYALHSAGLLSPMMATTNTLLGGVALGGAGLYQWSSLKSNCLRQCQSPLHFLTTHWRDGAGGAIRMGWTHGLYCLGCCWFLMCLLFVGGVMNLLWIAGLAVLVLIEKRWHSPWVPRLSG